MPELLDRCLDDGRGVLRQCHVGGHRNCTPAGLLDNRARRFEALHAARREHEVCPRLGKRLGERHPRPEEAPVTIATLPSRRKRSSTVVISVLSLKGTRRVSGRMLALSPASSA